MMRPGQPRGAITVPGRLLGIAGLFCHYELCGQTYCHIQGSHPTWKTLNTWNFVIYFTKIHFLRCHLKKNHLHLCHIYTMNTNIRSQIDLEFYCFYLEIIWKIHGVS